MASENNENFFFKFHFNILALRGDADVFFQCLHWLLLNTTNQCVTSAGRKFIISQIENKSEGTECITKQGNFVFKLKTKLYLEFC